MEKGGCATRYDKHARCESGKQGVGPRKCNTRSRVYPGRLLAVRRSAEATRREQKKTEAGSQSR